MAATEASVAAAGAAAPPAETEDGAGAANSTPGPSCAGASSTREGPPPARQASSPDAAAPEVTPPPPAAAPAALEVPLGAAPLARAPLAEAAPRSRPGPETFRQRFRQFRYQDAAGPREAFRQLRELSRQWLRPDIRTKEQIVEMLVQEQLLAILPEAARARRLGRRTDVRITG